MLIWDGGLIKVEIGRKDRRNCHAGPIKQITLTSEEELITVGADGAVRVSVCEHEDMRAVRFTVTSITRRAVCLL